MIASGRIARMYAGATAAVAVCAGVIGRRPIAADRDERPVGGILVTCFDPRERRDLENANLVILDDPYPIDSADSAEPQSLKRSLKHSQDTPARPPRQQAEPALPVHYWDRPEWEQRVIRAALSKRERRSAKWAALMARGKFSSLPAYLR